MILTFAVELTCCFTFARFFTVYNKTFAKLAQENTRRRQTLK